MTEPGHEIRSFVEAANWATALVAAVPREALDGPGLGDWNLRALIGHTSRSLLTVEQYSSTRAEREDIASAEEYYEAVAAIPSADAAQVLQRGVDAGAALGADPSAAFAEIAARVTRLVQTSGFGDRVITTIAGGMRLGNYLPTRTFELVVHGLDIARAVRADPEPPQACLSDALDLIARLGMRSGHGSEMILALTGRTTLPAGFSVLP